MGVKQIKMDSKVDHIMLFSSMNKPVKVFDITSVNTSVNISKI